MDTRCMTLMNHDTDVSLLSAKRIKGKNQFSESSQQIARFNPKERTPDNSYWLHLQARIYLQSQTEAWKNLCIIVLLTSRYGVPGTTHVLLFRSTLTVYYQLIIPQSATFKVGSEI